LPFSAGLLTSAAYVLKSLALVMVALFGSAGLLTSPGLLASTFAARQFVAAKATVTTASTVSSVLVFIPLSSLKILSKVQPESAKIRPRIIYFFQTKAIKIRIFLKLSFKIIFGQPVSGQLNLRF
jgi:hypothetical protein